MDGRGGSIHRSTWNTSWSTAISDSSAGSTPRRDQARPEMQSRHVGLRRHLGRFPVCLASRACLPSGAVLSIRRSGSTSSALNFTAAHFVSKYHSRATTRGTQCPGAESLGGADKSQRCRKFFLQYIYSQNTLGSNMGTQNLFLALGAIPPRSAPLSHRGLFAKIPSLPIALEIIFLSTNKKLAAA